MLFAGSAAIFVAVEGTPSWRSISHHALLRIGFILIAAACLIQILKWRENGLRFNRLNFLKPFTSFAFTSLIIAGIAWQAPWRPAPTQAELNLISGRILAVRYANKRADAIAIAPSAHDQNAGPKVVEFKLEPRPFRNPDNGYRTWFVGLTANASYDPETMRIYSLVANGTEHLDYESVKSAVDAVKWMQLLVLFPVSFAFAVVISIYTSRALPLYRSTRKRPSRRPGRIWFDHRVR